MSKTRRYSNNVIFTRILLQNVMNIVRKHTTPKQRKSVWTLKYSHEENKYEAQSTGKDKVVPSYWYGSAFSAYEARANFWMQWLESKGIGDW